jgi:nitrogen fixation protein FixH
MRANAYTPANPLTGRTVLVVIVCFFVVVFAVNGVFLFLALSTNTGVVAVEPYRKGLKYNDRVAAEQRQRDLGWTSDILIAADETTLVATIRDRDGNGVHGLTAAAKIGRAATDREDVEAKLIETTPGRYEAKLLLSGTGSYVANLEVMDPSTAAPAVAYRARRRIWLKP